MKTIAETILQGLSTQTFFDWHENDFAFFVEGDKDAKSEEEILQDINSMFRLPKEKKEKIS